MLEIVLLIPCLPDLDLSANRRRSRHYNEVHHPPRSPWRPVRLAQQGAMQLKLLAAPPLHESGKRAADFSRQVNCPIRVEV